MIDLKLLIYYILLLAGQLMAGASIIREQRSTCKSLIRLMMLRFSIRIHLIVIRMDQINVINHQLFCYC